jgi:hypothetical protein
MSGGLGLRDRGVSLHRVQIDEGEPLPDRRDFAGSAMSGSVPSSLTRNGSITTNANERNVEQ